MLWPEASEREYVPAGQLRFVATSARHPVDSSKLWDYTHIEMAPGLAADMTDLSPATLVRKHYADAKADQASLSVAPLAEYFE